jgi:Flp pilus assembly pilin Flp
MAALLRQVHRFVSREEGQDLVEYAMVAALIAIAAVAVVSSLGQQIYTMFWQNIAQASF